MWGVNGLTSVAGSVLAMVVAKAGGFSTVLLLGLACYVLVAGLVKVGWAFGNTGLETGATEASLTQG
jgi:hypothetical protein